MKKFLAILLALAMVMAMAACGSQPAAPADTNQPADTTPADNTPAADPQTPEVTEPSVAAGTSWNSVDDFNREAGQEGAWQYYFFDPADSSYNPMGGYEERNDGSLCEWYPWGGCWVGVGFNADVPGMLEMNCESSESMRAVLAFCAPAAGKYVINACAQNPWSQDADALTFTKADGTVVLAEDMSAYVEVAGYVTPTEVELAEGELLYIDCNSTSGSWVSAYVNVTMYYEPTDASVYEKPEVEIPVTYTFVNSADAEYSATAEFGTESVWVYASTEDGVSFADTVSYSEPDWNGDGAPDAAQYYSANGTGVGRNFDVAGYLEANVPDAGSEAMAIGFKAPADGTYTVAGYTNNVWGQNAAGVYVVLNGEVLAETTLGTPDEFSVTAELKAGEVVYVFAQSNGGWVSAYLDVYAGTSVTLTGEWVADNAAPVEASSELPYEAVEGAKYDAVNDFSSENADGTWVYAITTDGENFEVLPVCIAREWDDDEDVDALEWYRSEDDYTGIGLNADAYGYLEANVSDTFANGGSAAALGFKAPADGRYDIVVIAQNLWGQSAYGVNISMNGVVVSTVGYGEEAASQGVSIDMKAGEIVYIYGDAADGWLSTYIQVYVF